MYDPIIGRWTTQDPIEFMAGDPDLYRYVDNSPTNAIDPSGLRTHWETIGIAKGPKFASIAELIEKDSMPHISWKLTQIVYQQVRGNATDLGAGTWSQPGGAAGVFKKSKGEGGANIVNVGDFKGIAGWLKFTGVGEICNTIISSDKTKADPDLSHTGTVRAIFKDFKPGSYQVKIRYKIGIQASGYLSANVTFLHQDNGSIAPKPPTYNGNAFPRNSSNPPLPPNASRVTGWTKDINTTVVIPPNSSEVEVAKLRPVVTGQTG